MGEMFVPLVFGTLHVPAVSPTSLTASYTAVRWESLSKDVRVTTFITRPGSDSPADLPSSTIKAPSPFQDGSVESCGDAS